MKHSSDIALAARILSADLARGIDWAAPARRPSCLPLPRVRTLVAGSVLVLTSLLSSVASAGPLTDSFAAALGRPVPTATAAPKAKAAPVAREWRCGAWEPLCQGRGNGRTCEWTVAQ